MQSTACAKRTDAAILRSPEQQKSLSPNSLSSALAMLLLGIAFAPDAAANARSKHRERVDVRTLADHGGGRGGSGDSSGSKPFDLPRVQVNAKIVELIGFDPFLGHLWSGNRIFSTTTIGSGFSSNPGAEEQETQDKEGECGETSGNPVVLATGNKVEPELDFASEGEMGLYLQRTYNSFWSANGLFGGHWLSNLDYTLAPSRTGDVLWAQRPDGRRIKFVSSASGNRWNEDKALPVAYVSKSADGSYTLHNEQGGSERYSADGYITELKNEFGVTWTFTYSNKYLQQVTHSSGRTMRFTWSAGQLTQAIDPAGNIYRYTYTPNVFGTGSHRLASVGLPGAPATSITYHYEDSRFPGGLTGKSFNGARYSTFAYDSAGRAIKTEHAGGVERYTFSYVVESSESVTPPPAPPRPGGFGSEEDGGEWCEYVNGQKLCYVPQSMPATGLMVAESTASAGSTKQRPFTIRVTETNPLGKKTTYQYEDGRRVSVEGAASPNCAASYKEMSYDANGYANIVSDFSDGLTNFDYDAHGHLLKRIEAAGAPEERTTNFAWDEPNNRLTRITIPGYQEISYSYGSDKRIASETTKNLTGNGSASQTRTTTYTYTKHGNGLLAIAVTDGPIPGTSDTVTYSYNTSGDLTQVKNGLGQIATYSNYDLMGRPGRATGPNGDIVDYVYDARGRTIAVKPLVGGVAQPTTYSYDGVGRLASVQRPDGTKRNFEYDAAWRLIREYEPEAGGTYAQTRYTYNAASLPTSVVTERTSAVHSPSAAPALNVPALGANGTYTVQWNAVAGAESYMLQENANSGTWVTAYSGGSRSKSYTGKPAGNYAYRVKACNAAGCGGWSSSGSARVVYKPTTAPMPSVPSQNTDGSYTVTWPAVTGATVYRLDESKNGGAWTQIHNAAAVNKAVSGKTAATYRYRVTACNEAGCGPVSAIASVLEIDPPTAIPVLRAPAVNTTGSYTVAWGAAPGANRYTLYESANGGAWTLVHNGAAISKALSGRSTAAIYKYKGQACNAAGCSTYSAAITVQKVIYDSQVVSHYAPSHMFSDDKTTIVVKIKNVGNMPWKAGSFYLGRNQSNYSMPERIALGSQIAPGQTATFSYEFTAPRGPVTPMPRYYFSGRMAADGIGWFGPVVPVATVTVENAGGYCPPGSHVCEDPR